MATSKVSEANTTPVALMADELADFVLIRTEDVDFGERLRAVDPVWAAALGQVMAREGQRTPIEVCRLPGSTRWTLVDGAHRLTGAREAEIEYLRAEIVSADRADRKMREISATVWRRDLDPVDRAAFFAELVSLRRTQAGLEEAAGRAAKVNVSLKKQVDTEADQMLETISSIYGFTDEIGAELGLTGRTIRNDLMIFRGVAPSLIAKLREARHPIYRNATQLRALAKLPAATQLDVVVSLIGGNAKNVSDAVARLHGSNRAGDPAAKRLSAFIGAFSRMGLAEKKGALLELRELLPTGFKLVEAEPVPAVAIRASVKIDHLVCLDCGERLERLPIHLAEKHDLKPVEYLARWKLPMDYPFIAPNLSDDDEGYGAIVTTVEAAFEGLIALNFVSDDDLLAAKAKISGALIGEQP